MNRRTGLKPQRGTMALWGTLVGALILAVLSIQPGLAYANAWTGGDKGPVTFGQWPISGTFQRILTVAPVSVDDTGAAFAYVALAHSPSYYGQDLIQIGYSYPGTLWAPGYAYGGYYFYYLASDSGYHAGPYWFPTGQVGVGDLHTYQMAQEGNLWVGRIDGSVWVHTGTSHIDWSVNEQQGLGEVYNNPPGGGGDYFLGGKTWGYCSWDDIWFEDAHGWHGGLLYQYHTAQWAQGVSGTCYGSNSISNPNPTSSYTTWDSRDQ